MRFFFLFGLLLVWACEQNITSQCEQPIDIDPTLSSIQRNLFNRYCVGCHSGAAPSGELDLSAGKALSSLVNVPAVGSGLLRVVPGNSEQSYLYRRLTGSGGVAVMPPGGKLAADYLTAVRQWIDQGAQNN